MSRDYEVVGNVSMFGIGGSVVVRECLLLADSVEKFGHGFRS